MRYNERILKDIDICVSEQQKLGRYHLLVAPRERDHSVILRVSCTVDLERSSR
jgi:hypothetical protein